MTMRFKLTPHVKAILKGRGMCKDDRLICASETCLFHPMGTSDPDYGKDIEIKGYGICPRCGMKTDYSAGIEWDDKTRTVLLKCSGCGRVIPKKYITWTQEVVSRHRRHKHFYYHAECWDKFFIDVEDDEEETALYSGQSDCELCRLIKWAQKLK